MVATNQDRRRSVRATWLLALAVGFVPLTGCNGFWDDLTARGYLQESFAPRPNPWIVLRESHDGDKIHDALVALGQVDPATLPPKDAEELLTVLIHKAGTERQVWVRLAAVQALGNWNDARAVEGLKDAYYRAGAFPGEGGTALKIYALTALGRCGHPSAVEMLVKVLSEPPDVGSVSEQQQKLEERLTAARSLGRYKSDPCTAALVNVLRKDTDPGLRTRARESLARITGRDLPADAEVWAGYLRDPASVPDKSLGERFRDILPASWRGDP